MKTGGPQIPMVEKAGPDGHNEHAKCQFVMIVRSLWASWTYICGVGVDKMVKSGVPHPVAWS
jgi:hypothetical protein